MEIENVIYEDVNYGIFKGINICGFIGQGEYFGLIEKSEEIAGSHGIKSNSSRTSLIHLPNAIKRDYPKYSLMWDSDLLQWHLESKKTYFLQNT